MCTLLCFTRQKMYKTRYGGIRYAVYRTESIYLLRSIRPIIIAYFPRDTHHAPQLLMSVELESTIKVLYNIIMGL